jgi:G3E family GTPase
VTVVDALRMRDEFGSGNDLMNPNIGEDDIENLVIQQIEFCNIILLNKASEISAGELEQLEKIIRTLQPKAEIITCDYGNVELDKIINTGKFNFQEVATSAAWIEEMDKPVDELHHDDDHDDDDHDDDDNDEHHEHHHHHHHDHEGGEVEEYGIGTYVYYSRRPFELGLFDEFVARKWPKGIIRAKGICYFRDEQQTCYLFEQAGKQVSISNAGQWYATMPKDELDRMLAANADLRRDWDEKVGDRMQKLVFIGQHLDREAIKRDLDFCLTD